MHRYRSAASVAAVLTLAVGCSSESDLFNEQTDGAAGTSAGSGGAGGSSSGTGGSSSGTGGSSSGTGGSSSGTGGSATGGASATGGTAGSSATGGAGGSGAVPGATVVCGTTTCNLSNQMCCDYHNTDPGCFEKGTYCFPGVDVTCDGPEDCVSGQVCCAKVLIHAQTAEYLSMTCQATCEAGDERVVCGSSGVCPSGQTCAESEIAPPYLECT